MPELASVLAVATCAGALALIDQRLDARASRWLILAAVAVSAVIVVLPAPLAWGAALAIASLAWRWKRSEWPVALALALAVVAGVFAPPLGAAALVALPWVRKPRRAEVLGLLGAAALVLALPDAWGLPSRTARALAFFLAGATAAIGTARIHQFVLGPAARRVLVMIACLTPALGIFGLLFANDRLVRVAKDDVLGAWLYAIAAAALGAILGAAIIGLVVLYSTKNGLRGIVAGSFVGALLGVAFFGLSAALVLLLPLALGLPIALTLTPWRNLASWRPRFWRRWLQRFVPQR